MTKQPKKTSANRAQMGCASVRSTPPADEMTRQQLEDRVRDLGEARGAETQHENHKKLQKRIREFWFLFSDMHRYLEFETQIQELVDDGDADAVRLLALRDRVLSGYNRKHGVKSNRKYSGRRKLLEARARDGLKVGTYYY